MTRKGTEGRARRGRALAATYHRVRGSAVAQSAADSVEGGGCIGAIAWTRVVRVANGVQIQIIGGYRVIGRPLGGARAARGLTAVTFLGLTHCERAGRRRPVVVILKRNIDCTKLLERCAMVQLAADISHIASCIHWCRRGRLRDSVVDWMIFGSDTESEPCLAM